jgi:hypothetical protein
MIIYPSAFILSEAAAGRPLTNSRIGWQTYTFDLSPAAVTVSTETAAGPKDAPLRPDTAEYWEPSALPATWQVDLGAARDIDYIGIAGHTLGSNAVSVEPETSLDAAAWVPLSIDTLPTNDSPIMFLDDSRSARHIRLTLTGVSAMPQIAVIYIGEVLAMEEEIIGAGFMPLTMSRQTVLHRSMSRGGQFLGQGIRRNGVTGTANFEFLTPAWYRSEFDPFVEHARQFPYFFGWCPELYPAEVGYVWTGVDIIGSYSGKKDWMQVKWNMQGIGNA